MEYFYREMRRKTGLLMDGDAPAGGQWNYDAENRKRLPQDVVPPPRWRAAPDARCFHQIFDRGRSVSFTPKDHKRIGDEIIAID